MVRLLILILFLIMQTFLSGCTRGEPFEEEPFHLVRDMDFQPKYEAQEASDFFVDGAAGRLPVEGTVARGQLAEDDELFSGKQQNSEAYALENPVPLTQANLEQGQERFGIYCLMCHGERGLGDGIVIEKGFFQPPSYLDQNLREFADGQIFATISEGARNMQSYKQQIPIEDRWRIVHYVRHLQQSGPVTGKEK